MLAGNASWLRTPSKYFKIFVRVYFQRRFLSCKLIFLQISLHHVKRVRIFIPLFLNISAYFTAYDEICPDITEMVSWRKVVSGATNTEYFRVLVCMNYFASADFMYLCKLCLQNYMLVNTFVTLSIQFAVKSTSRVIHFPRIAIQVSDSLLEQRIF